MADTNFILEYKKSKNQPFFFKMGISSELYKLDSMDSSSWFAQKMLTRGAMLNLSDICLAEVVDVTTNERRRIYEDKNWLIDDDGRVLGGQR